MVDDDQLARAARRGHEVAEAVEGPAVEGEHELGLGREVLRLGEQVETGELR